MKFCSKCGKEIEDNATVCPYCGVPAPEAPAPDAPNMGFAVLGFLVPIAGLILWLTMKDQTPLKAKSAGKGALIGAIVSVASVVLFWICYIILAIVVGLSVAL